MIQPMIVDFKTETVPNDIEGQDLNLNKVKLVDVARIHSMTRIRDKYNRNCILQFYMFRSLGAWSQTTMYPTENQKLYKTIESPGTVPIDILDSLQFETMTDWWEV